MGELLRSAGADGPKPAKRGQAEIDLFRGRPFLRLTNPIVVGWAGA
jgi:hypothetical protein